MIKVNTSFYLDLLENYKSFIIPDYQRSYSWDKNKLEDLLTDWEEFLDKGNNGSLSYYMGVLLLFENKDKKFEIIDGQQRITTLALIYYVLKNKLPMQGLQYNHYGSAFYISNNLQYLKDHIGRLKRVQSILSKLQFTIIISKNEDNAFSFFDSQNNRGISLGIDDYLKAYHLREIGESTQADMAKNWESIQFKARKKGKNELGLEHLFNQILFKSRKWRGQNYFEWIIKENILSEFQKNTLEPSQEKKYRLFPNKDNMKHQMIEFDEKNQVEFISKEAANQSKHMPFCLRQPLYKGHNFFEFTFKYNQIFHHLFYSKTKKSPATEMAKNFYEKVYSKSISPYLKNFMQLCLVAYYDNFGKEKIYKAIIHLDYYIGSLRLDKYYVRKEAVVNLLKNGKNNLLDVILNAFLPEEIFQFTKNENQINSIYNNKTYLIDKKPRNRVTQNYIDSVKRAFDKNNSDFKNRKLWME